MASDDPPIDRRRQGEAVAESYLGFIEEYGVLWGNTGNPLYVWAAIELCFRVRQFQIQAETGVWPGEVPVEPYPFPAWCMSYLLVSAVRIGVLAEGYDYLRMPSPFGEAGDTSRKRPSSTSSPSAISRIDVSKARGLVPSALSLGRKGSKAILNYRNVESYKLDDLSLAQFRLDGHGPAEALAKVCEEAGIVDPRSIQRRIAAARRAYAPRKTKKPRE